MCKRSSSKIFRNRSATTCYQVVFGDSYSRMQVCPSSTALVYRPRTWKMNYLE